MGALRTRVGDKRAALDEYINKSIKELVAKGCRLNEVRIFRRYIYFTCTVGNINRAVIFFCCLCVVR